MKFNFLLKLSFGVIVVIVGLFALSIVSKSDVQKNGHEVLLVRPSFVDEALALEEDTVNTIGDKLDQEAGISAYYKAPTTINLEQVKSVFSTIELETADYIVGSVPVPDYPEHYHTHVYVHKDGWILAYYLREAQVSKIIDVRAKSIDTTIFHSIVGMVAGAGGAPFTNVTYYDFRYPNATNMLLVAENYDGGANNRFEITLPPEFGYFELSWALHDWGGHEYFSLDGTNKLSSASFWDGAVGYGGISSSELLPGTEHLIEVDNYGVLVVVYRVP